MVPAFARWALLAALLAAPSAARADDGFWPSWLTVPWSGGTPPQNNSPRDPTGSSGPTKESEKIVKLPATPADVDCPNIDVFDGGATARVGGADSQSVRYQFDIVDTARQCLPQGSQFALTIGVAGRLLIGPAGSPGAYTTALHVEVKRDLDNKVLFQKSYKIGANTEGGLQGSFRLLTDPIMLPLTRARLDQDYDISVGFGATGETVTRHVRKRRHS